MSDDRGKMCKSRRGPIGTNEPSQLLLIRLNVGETVCFYVLYRSFIRSRTVRYSDSHLLQQSIRFSVRVRFSVRIVGSMDCLRIFGL